MSFGTSVGAAPPVQPCQKRDVDLRPVVVPPPETPPPPRCPMPPQPARARPTPSASAARDRLGRLTSSCELSFEFDAADRGAQPWPRRSRMTGVGEFTALEIGRSSLRRSALHRRTRAPGGRAARVSRRRAGRARERGAMARVRLQDVAEHAGRVDEDRLQRRARRPARRRADARAGAAGDRRARLSAEHDGPAARDGAHRAHRAGLRGRQHPVLRRAVARRLAVAPRHGYRVLLEETEGTLEGERALVARARPGLVDGMLFQPSVMSSTEIARHAARSCPWCCWARDAAPLTHRPRDDRERRGGAGGHRARRRDGPPAHRLRRARERGPDARRPAQRIAGYQQALEAAGLRPNPDLLIASDAISAAGAVPGGRRRARRAASRSTRSCAATTSPPSARCARCRSAACTSRMTSR